MPPVTEILVHISGPASASDDNRYRRMAAAYTDDAFRPLPLNAEAAQRLFVDDSFRAAQAICSQLLSSSLLVPPLQQVVADDSPAVEEARRKLRAGSRARFIFAASKPLSRDGSARAGSNAALTVGSAVMTRSSQPLFLSQTQSPVHSQCLTQSDMHSRASSQSNMQSKVPSHPDLQSRHSSPSYMQPHMQPEQKSQSYVQSQQSETQSEESSHALPRSRSPAETKSQCPHMQSQQPNMQSLRPDMQPNQSYMQSSRPNMQSRRSCVQPQQPHMQSQQSTTQSQQSMTESQSSSQALPQSSLPAHMQAQKLPQPHMQSQASTQALPQSQFSAQSQLRPQTPSLPPALPQGRPQSPSLPCSLPQSRPQSPSLPRSMARPRPQSPSLPHALLQSRPQSPSPLYSLLQSRPQSPSLSHPLPQPQAPSRPQSHFYDTGATFTQVFSPDPPVGLSETFSLPSPPSSLATLTVSQPYLAAALHGVTFTRPVAQDERGHWVIPHSTMKLILDAKPYKDEFHAFWVFLRDFVARGEAGWDVSLFVESPRVSGLGRDYARSTAPEANAHDPSPGTIRLYSFASVAAHMYLLLFIASKSAISRAECAADVQWIDANGDAVGFYKPLPR